MIMKFCDIIKSTCQVKTGCDNCQAKEEAEAKLIKLLRWMDGEINHRGKGD